MAKQAPQAPIPSDQLPPNRRRNDSGDLRRCIAPLRYLVSLVREVMTW